MDIAKMGSRSPILSIYFAWAGMWPTAFVSLATTRKTEVHSKRVNLSRVATLIDFGAFWIRVATLIDFDAF